jgi:murein DD-endopeptidase MepM/ murein hydrolase activator NlpD
MSSSAAVSPGLRIAYQVAAVAVLAALAAGCSSSRFGGPDRFNTTGAVAPQPVYNQPVPPALVGGGVQSYQPITPYQQPTQQYGTQTNNVAAPPITTAALPPAAAPAAAAGTATPQQQGSFVTVVSGDTLYSMSRAYGVSVAAIAAANGLTQSSMLSVGQRLFIPAVGSQAALAAPSAPLGVLPANGAAAAAPASGIHLVQMGETVYSISRLYGVTPTQLAAANNMNSIELIQVGQQLVIPGVGAVQPVYAAAQPAATATPPAPATNLAAQPAQQVAAIPNNGVAAQPSTTGTQFLWPIDGSRNILSDFGVKPGGERNDGINLAAQMGTQIRAAEGGVVIYAGNGIAGYGNLILIEHTDNWVTAYAHTSQMLVQRDQTVQRGQVIGLAGNTGSVSSPQLHFELRRGTVPVNPLDYLAN